jgi:hypothetical protein
MPSIAIIGICTLTPLLLAVLFRLKSQQFFLAVAVGILLAESLGGDAGWLLGLFSQSQSIESYARLIVFALPMLFTIIFAKGGLAPSKLATQLIFLIMIAAMAAVKILDYLPVEIQKQIEGERLGKTLDTSSSVIIASTSVVMLISSWLGARKGHKH